MAEPDPETQSAADEIPTAAVVAAFSDVQYMNSPGQYKAWPASLNGFPQQIGGVECFYYWKDVIRPGQYPAWKKGPNGEKIPAPLLATPQLCQRWVDVGKKMLKAGVPNPIICDHNTSAFSTIGNVVGFKLDPTTNTVYELCQFIGSERRDIALSNYVSIGRNPNYVDASGKDWGDALVHLAATNDPAMIDQGSYIQAASRTNTGAAQDEPPKPAPVTNLNRSSTMDDGMINCSAEHEKLLRQHIPGMKDCPREEMMSRLVQHHATMAKVREKLAGGPSVVAHMSREQIEEAADANIGTAMKARDEELPSLRTLLADKDRQIQNLSANTIKPLDPDSLDLALEATQTALERAVERGGISPATRDRLFETFGKNVKGDACTVMLSRQSSLNRSAIPLVELAKILAENKPVEVGERTGLQTLSREVPGIDPQSPMGQMWATQLRALGKDPAPVQA